MKEEPHEQARRIREIEATDERLKGRKIIAGSVADPAIWNKSTGVSVVDAMEAEGIYVDKGDHERLAGFMIKGWFKTDEGWWYYLGEDGVYDALRSSLPFRDKNRIEIVE